jgi:hypothetical protein
MDCCHVFGPLRSLSPSPTRLLNSQRSQQLVGGVRRAFLLTITVTDSESLLPEVPELHSLKGSSAE